MNLKRVNKSAETFTVGNINDYINVINKTNVANNSKVQVSDLQELEEKYNDLRCSYSIEIFEDKDALKSIPINESLFLNINLI